MNVELVESLLDALSFPLLTPDLLGKERVASLHASSVAAVRKAGSIIVKGGDYINYQPKTDKGKRIVGVVNIGIWTMTAVALGSMMFVLFTSETVAYQKYGWIAETLGRICGGVLLGAGAFFLLSGAIYIAIMLIVILLYSVLAYSFNGTLLYLGAMMFFVARGLAIYKSAF